MPNRVIANPIINSPFGEPARHFQFDDEGITDILEVTGEKKKDKAAKVATARNLWIPAVNNHGALGRWAFIEIDDSWNAANLICQSVPNIANPAPT